MKRINFKKGISLVETIIYVAIFGVFMVGLAQFSNSLTSTRLHAQGVLEVNDQGSRAVKLITETLRGASSVNGPSIGTSGTSLSVVTNVPATSPTVFSLSGGVIYITEGSGLPIALTNNKVVASNLTFSNLSRVSTPNIIKVSFTLASASSVGSYSVVFDASGALRK